MPLSLIATSALCLLAIATIPYTTKKQIAALQAKEDAGRYRAAANGVI